MSHHGLGSATDFHWSSPSANPLADIRRYVAHFKSQGYSPIYKHRMYGKEIGSLYDHVVTVLRAAYQPHEAMDPPWAAWCACGWKSTGEDAEIRGTAHLRKLRVWLDAHPDEETLAAFGGQVPCDKAEQETEGR